MSNDDLPMSIYPDNDADTSDDDDESSTPHVVFVDSDSKPAREW
jgi:hypothetical protein